MADRHPRIIISTEGAEGSGKTRFALSAPGPIWWQDFDFGLEGVEGAEKVAEHKTYDLMAASWQSESEQRKYALDTMRRYVADFREGLAKKARTLVTDTFTAAWAGQRFARSDDKYIEMETEFKSLVQAAYASPHTNVILIHHMRADWKKTSDGKSYKAGTFSRDGMDGIAAMVQLALRQRFVQPVPEQKAGVMVVRAMEPGRFELDVLKSRDNIGLVGQTYPGMDFTTLCSLVAPTIDWSK